MTTLPRYTDYLSMETLTSTKLGEPYPVIFRMSRAVNTLAKHWYFLWHPCGPGMPRSRGQCVPHQLYHLFKFFIFLPCLHHCDVYASHTLKLYMEQSVHNAYTLWTDCRWMETGKHKLKCTENFSGCRYRCGCGYRCRYRCAWKEMQLNTPWKSLIPEN